MSIRGIDQGGITSEPQGPQQQHTVQQGDTLQSIADQHGVLPEVVLKANPHIGDGSNLKAGMTLEVPNLSTGLTAGVAGGADSLEKVPPPSPFEAIGKAQSSFQPLFEAKLSPQQIDIQPQGVVIKNDSLNNFFKTFLNRPDTTGEKISFNFTRPGDAQAYKPLAGEGFVNFLPGDAQGITIRPDAGEAGYDYRGIRDAQADKIGAGEAQNEKWTPGDPSTEGLLEAGANKISAGETKFKEWGGTEASTINFNQGDNSSGETKTAPEVGGALGPLLTADQFEFNSDGNLVIHSNELGSALKQQFENLPEAQDFHVARKID